MQVVDRVAESQTKSDVRTELLRFVLNILIATFVRRFALNRSLVKRVTRLVDTSCG